MSGCVRIERNWWLFGLHEAEELYRNGFRFIGVDDIGGYVFKHPLGGTAGFHFGDEYEYKKGVLDYVDHWNNNQEIFSNED